MTGIQSVQQVLFNQMRTPGDIDNVGTGRQFFKCMAIQNASGGGCQWQQAYENICPGQKFIQGIITGKGDNALNFFGRSTPPGNVIAQLNQFAGGIGPQLPQADYADPDIASLQRYAWLPVFCDLIIFVNFKLSAEMQDT